MQLLSCTGYCGVSQLFFPDDYVYNFTSFGFPNQYPNDLYCEWFIVDANQLIIDIMAFDVERGYDYVNIGVGADARDTSSIIAKLTGDTKLARMTSTHESIWIQMVTDATGNQMGFFFSFLRVENLDSGMFDTVVC